MFVALFNINSYRHKVVDSRDSLKGTLFVILGIAETKLVKLLMRNSALMDTALQKIVINMEVACLSAVFPLPRNRLSVKGFQGGRDDLKTMLHINWNNQSIVHIALYAIDSVLFWAAK